MKLSFHTWPYSSSISWLPSYPLEEVIKRVASIGYEGVEIGAASPHAWPAYMEKGKRESTRKLLEECNMEVCAICPALGGEPGNNPASPLLAERETAIKYYKQCVGLAQDLGSKMVTFVAGWIVYGVSKKQAWNRAKQCLVETAKYAQDKEIIMVVEPVPGDSDLVETADDGINLMKESEMSNVKVMLDTFHVFYRDEIPADYVYKMKDDLVYVHVSDTDRLPPGKGKKDFRTFIQALKDIGYQGYLTVEVGFSRKVDPDTFAMQAYEYLAPLIKEVGKGG